MERKRARMREQSKETSCSELFSVTYFNFSKVTAQCCIRCVSPACWLVGWVGWMVHRVFRQCVYYIYIYIHAHAHSQHSITTTDRRNSSVFYVTLFIADFLSLSLARSLHFSLVHYVFVCPVYIPRGKNDTKWKNRKIVS